MPNERAGLRSPPPDPPQAGCRGGPGWGVAKGSNLSKLSVHPHLASPLQGEEPALRGPRISERDAARFPPPGRPQAGRGGGPGWGVAKGSNHSKLSVHPHLASPLQGEEPRPDHRVSLEGEAPPGRRERRPPPSRRGEIPRCARLSCRRQGNDRRVWAVCRGPACLAPFRRDDQTGETGGGKLRPYIRRRTRRLSEPRRRSAPSESRPSPGARPAGAGTPTCAPPRPRRRHCRTRRAPPAAARRTGAPRPCGG